MATKGLWDLLLRSIWVTPADNKRSWHSDSFLMQEGGGEFGAGRLTISPTYFMLCHEVIVPENFIDFIVLK
jgi:hypothetical protein